MTGLIQRLTDWQKVLPEAMDAGATVNLHFGSRVTKKDEQGKSVLDEAGKPQTEWHDDSIESQKKWGWNKRGSGEDPSLVYGQGAHGSFQAGPDADAAIAEIRSARAAIPARKMGRSANNNAGWDHDPSSRPASHEADAGSQEYDKWLSQFIPEGIDPRLWKVYQQIQKLEAQPTRITTFDATLSIGAGLSTSGGQAQHVLGDMLKRLPELADTVRATGLWVTPAGDLTVVDTEKKWILKGTDAINYISTSTDLLSLIVDIMEGSMPTAANQPVEAGEADRERQQALMAQFENLRQQGHALSDELLKPRADGVAVIDWPETERILAVHAAHGYPGYFPYKFWDTHPHTSPAEVGEQLYLSAPESVVDTVVENTPFMNIGAARPQYRRDRDSADSAKRKANSAYLAAKAPEDAARAAEKAAASAEAAAQADNAPGSAKANAEVKRAKATELRSRADQDPKLADAVAQVAGADAAAKNARLEECDFSVRKYDIKIAAAQASLNLARANLEKLGEKSKGLPAAKAEVAADEKSLEKLTKERDALATEAAGLRDKDAVGAAKRAADAKRHTANALAAEAAAAAAIQAADKLQAKAETARSLADKAAGSKSEAKLVKAAEAAELAAKDARERADGAIEKARQLSTPVNAVQTSASPQAD